MGSPPEGSGGGIIPTADRTTPGFTGLPAGGPGGGGIPNPLHGDGGVIGRMLQQMADQAAQHQAATTAILRHMADNNRNASDHQDRAIAALNAAGARSQPAGADQLVDTRGISKPPTLTGKVAQNITSLKSGGLSIPPGLAVSIRVADPP